MRRRQPDNSEIIFKFIVGIAALLTISGAVWWFWPEPMPERVTIPPHEARRTEPPVPRKTIEKPQASPEPVPTLKYQEEDTDLKALMDRRKSEYGLEKSVDMIVRPDEKIIIGDTKITMQEILDKIRIKEGRITEQDLGADTVDPAKDRIDRLYTRLKEAERNYASLEDDLSRLDEPDAGALSSHAKGSGVATTPENLADRVKDHANLSQIMDNYASYKSALKESQDYQAFSDAKNPRAEIEKSRSNLISHRDQLAEKLKAHLRSLPNPPAEALPFHDALESLLKHYENTEAMMAAAGEAGDMEAVRKLMAERQALSGVVADYRAYQDTVERIKTLDALLALDDKQLKEEADDQLARLRMERDEIEDSLISQLLPGEKETVYGVYVVQPGDNIWNIHFRFLKEYFNARQIRLAAGADEPDPSGGSSGIGKILKFSEGMVFIYNLRERQLGEDLNLIHPLSKIVVFNMGRILDFLEDIKPGHIQKIRYDGETLWLPAE
jgi:hypothetical protein